MTAIYVDNDTDVVVEGLQLADDFSFITDAVLSVSLVKLDTASKGVVTNATNLSPITVTTSAAHGLTTGDEIVITDVEGNPAANGPQTVTVVDATSFTLDGSVGNGAYASGGVWYRSVAGAHDIALTWSATRRRYRGVLPGTIPLAVGTTYRRIITSTNYRVQWENDLTAAKRR